jgi:hypothetical protein
LVQTDEIGAQLAIERLRHNVKSHNDDLLSVSVGLAIAKEGEYLPAILRQADDRMYADKASYKENFVGNK